MYRPQQTSRRLYEICKPQHKHKVIPQILRSGTVYIFDFFKVYFD